MKQNKLKLITVVLLLMFIGAGCQKDEIEYADESIVVDNHPGVFVYKTKGNYIDNVCVRILPDGRLTGIMDLTRNIINNDNTFNVNNNFKVDNKGNVKVLFRHLLKSGYIVGGGHISAVFTDISFTEYLRYNEQNGITSWPEELIRSRIIDEDPYEELYFMGCLHCAKKEFTLREINKMIEEGTLETVFKKLK